MDWDMLQEEWDAMGEEFADMSPDEMDLLQGVDGMEWTDDDYVFWDDEEDETAFSEEAYNHEQGSMVSMYNPLARILEQPTPGVPPHNKRFPGQPVPHMSLRGATHHLRPGLASFHIASVSHHYQTADTLAIIPPPHDPSQAVNADSLFQRPVGAKKNLKSPLEVVVGDFRRLLVVQIKECAVDEQLREHVPRLKAAIAYHRAYLGVKKSWAHGASEGAAALEREGCNKQENVEQTARQVACEAATLAIPPVAPTLNQPSMSGHEVLCEMRLDIDHYSVAASPDGRFIAACGNNDNIYLYAYIRGNAAANIQPKAITLAVLSTISNGLILSNRKMNNCVRFGSFAGKMRMIVTNQENHVLFFALPPWPANGDDTTVNEAGTEQVTVAELELSRVQPQDLLVNDLRPWSETTHRFATDGMMGFSTVETGTGNVSTRIDVVLQNIIVFKQALGRPAPFQLLQTQGLARFLRSPNCCEPSPDHRWLCVSMDCPMVVLVPACKQYWQRAPIAIILPQPSCKILGAQVPMLNAMGLELVAPPQAQQGQPPRTQQAQHELEERQGQEQQEQQEQQQQQQSHEQGLQQQQLQQEPQPLPQTQQQGQVQQSQTQQQPQPQHTSQQGQDQQPQPQQAQQQTQRHRGQRWQVAPEYYPLTEHLYDFASNWVPGCQYCRFSPDGRYIAVTSDALKALFVYKLPGPCDPEREQAAREGQRAKSQPEMGERESGVDPALLPRMEFLARARRPLLALCWCPWEPNQLIFAEERRYLNMLDIRCPTASLQRMGLPRCPLPQATIHNDVLTPPRYPRVNGLALSQGGELILATPSVLFVAQAITHWSRALSSMGSIASGLPPAFTQAVRQLLRGAYQKSGTRARVKHRGTGALRWMHSSAAAQASSSAVAAGPGPSTSAAAEPLAECLLHTLPPDVLELIISKAALPLWEWGPALPQPLPIRIGTLTDMPTQGSTIPLEEAHEYLSDERIYGLIEGGWHEIGHIILKNKARAEAEAAQQQQRQQQQQQHTQTGGQPHLTGLPYPCKTDPQFIPPQLLRIVLPSEIIQPGQAGHVLFSRSLVDIEDEGDESMSEEDPSGASSLSDSLEDGLDWPDW